MRIVFLIVFMCGAFSVTESHAQFWKKKEKGQKERAYSTDISSEKPNTASEPKLLSSNMRFGKSKFPTAAEGIKRAQDLQASNAKKNAKIAKELETNPRYNDPSYFGHKHKPKKHRPGKKKFCKECGMTH